MHIAGGRFVVTGGASLIGSHLTQQLLEAGAAAVILFDNYALGSPEVAGLFASDHFSHAWFHQAYPVPPQRCRQHVDCGMRSTPSATFRP
jgi:nucleoside-diphosphate-sugar epimerase